MKKLIVIVTIGILSLGFGISTYASDWDTFGKVMAGVTGLRVITGGRVDIVGSVTGINRGNTYSGYYYYYPRNYRYYRYYPKRCHTTYYRSGILGTVRSYTYRPYNYRHRVIIKERNKRRRDHYHKDRNRRKQRQR